MEQPMAANSSKAKAVFLDFIERAGWSAGQVFFATVLAGGATVAGLPWKTAGALALGAAVSSMVLTALQYLGRFTNLSFWPDLVVRLAKTFLGSLGASISAAKVFDISTFHWSGALNIAALATLGALGKGLLARGEAVIPAALAGEHGADQDAGGVATGRAAPVVVGRVPVQTVRAFSTPSTLPTATYLNAIRR
jgi:hypothetical protein